MTSSSETEPPGSASSSPDECQHEEAVQIAGDRLRRPGRRISYLCNECGEAWTITAPIAPTAAQEAALDELVHLRQEMEAQPPRRPPYAVAYALASGELYEVALPGDAVATVEHGVLKVSHAQGVSHIVQVKPMGTDH